LGKFPLITHWEMQRIPLGNDKSADPFGERMCVFEEYYN